MSANVLHLLFLIKKKKKKIAEKKQTKIMASERAQNSKRTFTTLNL